MMRTKQLRGHGRVGRENIGAGRAVMVANSNHRQQRGGEFDPFRVGGKAGH